MPAIINNPPAPAHPDQTDSGLGFFIGLLVVIILGVLFFAYALPVMRRNSNSGTTNISVPDKINVDVNKY
jgi:hypothetical protein